MKTQVSLIIEARWIIPVIPRQTVYENHAIVIEANKIVDICSAAEVYKQYEANEVVRLAEHVLIPGLINLHTHAAMSLMRGLADGLSLTPWLQEHIWPAETKLISPEFIYDGAMLASAEMLSSGVTTFNDMYFFPESTANACLKMGMRTNLGLVVLEFPTQYANDADAYIEKGLAVRDHLRDEALVSFSFAPHAPYTVSDKTFERVATLANQVQIGVHTHLHETEDELVQSKKEYGLRPLLRLANIGLLGPNMTFAHCVHMDSTEIHMLAEHRCNIVHCPSSNLKLASGIAPVSQYLDANINTGLGTDGAASNNRMDIFTEMRLAALLAKGESGDAAVLPAHTALEMATINGAKALGQDDKLGSIEKGKLADLTAISLSALDMQPIFDPISHLIYVAGREHVTHTWVDGELRYHQPTESAGVYQGAEPRELSDIVSKWQTKVSEFK